MLSRAASLCLVLSLSLVLPASAQPGTGPALLEKKLIEYGWDCPTPAFVHQNIAAMNERPFDGVVMKLRGKDRFLSPEGATEPVLDIQGGSRVFHPEPFDEEDFAAEYDLLSQIEWGGYSDNFNLMFAASDQDWRDDAHWRAIENNVSLVARAGRIGRCAGIVLDPEPYGTNPWKYEDAYYYRERAEYLESYNLIRSRCRYVIDPALWPAYLSNMRVGQALYIDEYLNLRPDAGRRFLASYLSGEERLRWLEHNTFWALYSADRYVWCYSERVNWWDNGTVSPEEARGLTMSWPKDCGVPPGVPEALRSALEKYRAGQWLDFDLAPAFQRANADRRLLR